MFSKYVFNYLIREEEDLLGQSASSQINRDNFYHFVYSFLAIKGIENEVQFPNFFTSSFFGQIFISNHCVNHCFRYARYCGKGDQTLALIGLIYIKHKNVNIQSNK